MKLSMTQLEKTALYWPKGLYFWRARTKYAQGCLLDKERQGRWVFWYVSGQKQLEGEYLKGKKTGYWTKWAENGSKMHGRWIDWHGNGQKALESQWVMGKRDGKWLYWAVDGSLEKTETYDHRFEKDRGYSIHTDLETKEIIQEIQRGNLDRNWERLVGKFVAHRVKPWQIACWVLIFVPTLGLTRSKTPQHDVAFAAILALLVTGFLAWSLDKKARK
jgi:hypothetical protein